MNPWFRMYSEFATDPKVQMLSEVDQRRFVMLLCLRCSNGDVTLQDDEVTFQLRITSEEWAASKARFLAKNLISEDNDIPNWNKRQYVSDTSNSRVSRFREKRKRECNVTETVPDTDTDTDTDTEDKKVSCETGVPNEEKLAFEAYNDLAVEVGIPKAQALTDGRRTKIRQRLNECGGLTGWLDAMGKIRGSPFLRGDNKSGWKADLDFVLQKSSFTRLLEGSYDRQTGNRATAGQHRNSLANGFAILDAVTDEAIRRAGGLGQEGSQEDPWSIPGLRQGTA